MRKLQPHEQKLLKKVNLFDWKREQNVREIKILRRYHIQKREDYAKYNKLCGEITKIATKLSALDSQDPFRVQMTEQLLAKLYAMGLINSEKSLMKCKQITASAFCRFLIIIFFEEFSLLLLLHVIISFEKKNRRRLPVVLVRLKMAETLKQAVTYVEQGHVRVGPNVVTDPAFMVTRAMEDFVTWVDTSKIKEKVLKYNDVLDDYVLLGN
ncbi:U3 small nucleolar ribonucleoprotein imp3 [Balamuthia mandrillaris]